MGVTGLWKLIDPCGKPVPVETLEGKILAVGKYHLILENFLNLTMTFISFTRYIYMASSGCKRFSR